MIFNTNFFNTSLKYLTITRKVLPLIKEIKPYVNGIRNNLKFNIPEKRQILNNKNETINKNINNSLTFFK